MKKLFFILLLLPCILQAQVNRTAITNRVSMKGGSLQWLDDSGVWHVVADSATVAAGGGMVYPGAGIAKSTGSAWTTSVTDNSPNWNTVLNRLLLSDTATMLFNYLRIARFDSLIAAINANYMKYGDSASMLSPYTRKNFAATIPLDTTTYKLGLVDGAGVARKGNWPTFTQLGGFIGTLNGSTSYTQTFANGSSGTAPNWSTVTGTHTLNIPAAGSGITSGTITNVYQDIYGMKNFRDKIRIGAVSAITVSPDFQINNFAITRQTSPVSTRIGFGDGTGWKMHLGLLASPITSLPYTQDTATIMTWTDAGNVGIDQPNPVFPLDVTGEINSTGYAYHLSPSSADSSNKAATTKTVKQMLASYVGGGGGITAITGDLTASGTGSVAGTLATVNSNVGTFGSNTSTNTITVNGKGLITAVTNNYLDTVNSFATKLALKKSKDSAISVSKTITTDNQFVISGTTLSANKVVQSLSLSGVNSTWNVANGYNARLTITGIDTLIITNPQAGDYYTITIVQDGTGGRTLSLPGGSAAIISSAANDSTTLTAFYRNNAYEWRSPLQANNPVFLTSNFTTSSTTAVSTNLSFAIAPNEKYYVTIEGTASKATSSTGLKLAVGAPTGCTVVGEAYLGGATLAATQVPSLISAINTLGTTFATGTGVQVTFRETFLVQNSTTAGTITLQAATVTSNVATIYAGTRMFYTKATGL